MISSIHHIWFEHGISSCLCKARKSYLWRCWSILLASSSLKDWRLYCICKDLFFSNCRHCNNVGCVLTSILLQHPCGLSSWRRWCLNNHTAVAHTVLSLKMDNPSIINRNTADLVKKTSYFNHIEYWNMWFIMKVIKSQVYDIIGNADQQAESQTYLKLFSFFPLFSTFLYTVFSCFLSSPFPFPLSLHGAMCWAATKVSMSGSRHNVPTLEASIRYRESTFPESTTTTIRTK